MKMQPHQLVNQSSNKRDWMTPTYVLAPARLTMGGIDLDPASSPLANQTVKAKNIFTEIENGLNQPWFGRVWLNWPYGRRENKLWSAKILTEIDAGRIEQICFICYASTSEAWYQTLLHIPRIDIAGRVPFIDPETGEPASQNVKGSSLFYWGPEVHTFGLMCKGLGPLSVSHNSPRYAIEGFVKYADIRRLVG